MAEMIDWRRLSVHRDNRFNDLDEKFCSTKGAKSDACVFNTVKELMVFAALIGYQEDEYHPLNTKANTTPISLDTYATTNHDAYIFLLALAKNPSLDILKDESLKDAIAIFEGYCNGGLKIIDSWVMNNISEPLITNVLFKQTLNYLIEHE
ncbi:hypothetical protein [Vibrio hibernica]|uniref:hypothetical protein n=1 Tax=Vibrio hibernica TaxID=2587465 RepID=UPI0039AF0E2A